MTVTEQIQVYADTVNIDLESKLVTLIGIDAAAIVAEFPAEELLEAINAQHDLSTIVHYATSKLVESNE